MLTASICTYIEKFLVYLFSLILTIFKLMMSTYLMFFVVLIFKTISCIFNVKKAFRSSKSFDFFNITTDILQFIYSYEENMNFLFKNFKYHTTALADFL